MTGHKAGLITLNLQEADDAVREAVRTAMREPSSMLAAMFSGKGFKMETDESGAYFIDRDGTHFRHILNYLGISKVIE